jgi:hypothetical protein
VTVSHHTALPIQVAMDESPIANGKTNLEIAWQHCTAI